MYARLCYFFTVEVTASSLRNHGSPFKPSAQLNASSATFTHDEPLLSSPLGLGASSTTPTMARTRPFTTRFTNHDNSKASDIRSGNRPYPHPRHHHYGHGHHQDHQNQCLILLSSILRVFGISIALFINSMLFVPFFLFGILPVLIRNRARGSSSSIPASPDRCFTPGVPARLSSREEVDLEKNGELSLGSSYGWVGKEERGRDRGEGKDAHFSPLSLLLPAAPEEELDGDISPLLLPAAAEFEAEGFEDLFLAGTSMFRPTLEGLNVEFEVLDGGGIGGDLDVDAGREGVQEPDFVIRHPDHDIETVKDMVKTAALENDTGVASGLDTLAVGEGGNRNTLLERKKT